MLLHVTVDGFLRHGSKRYRCALGRGGVQAEKMEGDGVTPSGRYPLRRLLYRADRLTRPVSKLAMAEIRPDDGWCDAPADPAYNRPVNLPYRASTESMWREDSLYDLVLILGHNDDPIVPGAGSAIFMHVASPEYGPTEGCVALARDDLLELLSDLDNNSEIKITA